MSAEQVNPELAFIDMAGLTLPQPADSLARWKAAIADYGEEDVRDKVWPPTSAWCHVCTAVDELAPVPGGFACPAHRGSV